MYMENENFIAQYDKNPSIFNDIFMNIKILALYSCTTKLVIVINSL